MFGRMRPDRGFTTHYDGIPLRVAGRDEDDDLGDDFDDLNLDEDEDDDGQPLPGEEDDEDDLIDLDDEYDDHEERIGDIRRDEIPE